MSYFFPMKHPVFQRLYRRRASPATQVNRQGAKDAKCCQHPWRSWRHGGSVSRSLQQFSLDKAVKSAARVKGRRRPSRARNALSALFALVALVLVPVAQADLAQDVLKLTGGQRARIVWLRGQNAIVALDTADGQVRTLHRGDVGERSWPILSTDGQTLFFAVVPPGRGEVGTVYALAWDAAAGTTPTELCAGMAPVAVWCDPATQVEWLYVATQPGKDRRPSHIRRYRTDAPATHEPVWDKTDADAPFSLSADGRYGCTQAPWPNTSLVTLPNGEAFPGTQPGCNANVCADNSYRLFALNASHTEIYLYRDLMLGPARPYKVLTIKVDNTKTHRVRASNHPRLFTYFGPMASAKYSDVFLAKFNADYTALEATVRLTEDKANNIENTLPYAWLEVTDRSDFAYPLGQFHGEAPLPVDLPAYRADAAATWTFGDGQTGRGRVARHVYEQAGDFALTLETGGQKLAGRVRVRPAEAPRIVAVDSLGINRLKVRFSEKVAVAPDARATLASGNAVRSLAASDDGLALIVDLERPLARTDRLTLTGIADRAARPNALPATPADVVRPVWPSEPRGLVALWNTETFYGLDPATKRYEGLALESEKLRHPCGFPILDRFGRLILPTNPGATLPALVPNAGALAETVGRTGRFSLELGFTPRSLTTQVYQKRQNIAVTVPHDLCGWYALSSGGLKPEFAVTQSNATLCVRMADGVGGIATYRIAELGAVRPVHLVVTCEPGSLAAYVDGKPTLQAALPAKLALRWGPVPLSGGDRWAPRWSGWLDAAALYDRALPPAEVAANHAVWRDAGKARAVPEYGLIRAELIATSTVPKPEQIAPYRNALVVNEYAVLDVLRGHFPSKKVRVAEWGLYDTEPVKSWAFRPGSRAGKDVRLLLEPFSGKSEQELIFDTLAEDFEVPTMLRVEEWIVP